MTMPEQKSQALILILLVLLVLMGPADAVRPQQLSVAASVTSMPAAMPAAMPAPLITVVDDKPAIVAEEHSSLLPMRAPHDGVSADLFAGHSWYTPPPPVAQVQRRSKPANRAPSAPPLPFSFIGSFEQEGAATLYFLVKGDRVYDVSIGDKIEGTYSVDSVSNGQLMFTYLPLKSSQGLRLGE